MNGPAISQLRALMAARDEVDKLDDALAAAKKRKKALEEEVAEAIEAGQIKGAHTVDVGPPWGVQSFTPSEKVYASIYDEEALAEWVAARGFEKAMMTFEPKPRKAALNSWVKRAPTVGEELPAGVERGETKYITVTDRNPKT